MSAQKDLVKQAWRSPTEDCITCRPPFESRRGVVEGGGLVRRTSADGRDRPRTCAICERGGHDQLCRQIAGKNAAITPWATVQNNCAFTYKVKVVWNNGADSPCQTLSVREQYTDTSTPGATYDGVKIC
ncbi:hypothetical protein E1267_18640 [Nonomuraea longispora]|uniref:Uncharacterized protein n=1 Tax=Nonomuraea longispora TaxID=1848320 RepID=A0A4R4NG08_9ACTN|nr:hypothetical protein E1267_18640 [Nonomuraea longispora]